MADNNGDKPPASQKPSSPKPSKREEKKDAKERGSKRKEREVEAERVLAAELDHLRRIVREIANRYMHLLESEIAQIREVVAASAGSSDRLARLTAMLRAVEHLKVKPKKGRRKDLKRIEALVAHLNRITQKLQ